MTINKKYGYVRVSSKSQESNSSIEFQKQQLIQNGIEAANIRVEIGSAVNEIKNRLVFQQLLEELKPNDLLMVTKIDRCSRNTLEFLKLQDILFKRNIIFVALDLPTSVDLAKNKLIATTLSGIAEFENNRRKERQKEGIRAAQAQGKYKGRKSVINKKLIQKIKSLKEDKNLSILEISKLLEISRPTIYKVLKNELGYVSNRLVKQEKKNETIKISQSKSLNQMQEFQSLLQFLTFTSQLEAKKNYIIGDQEYYFLEFYLTDFLNFLGKSKLSIHQANYQRQKMKEFFNKLQTNAPIIERFSENSFQRAISIPYYEMIKTGRGYIVQLAVAPQLYSQKYPFKLPKKFLFYENAYDLRIKLEIIESLAQSEIQKQFFVKEFLDHFKVSNGQKTYIKFKIIELLLELENERVIDCNFIFIYKDNHVKKLNSLNNFDMKYFTQLHYIYFYENLIIDKK